MTFTKSGSSSSTKKDTLLNPLPSHANDLTVKEIPLSIRTQRLDQLSKIKSMLNDIHDSIILYNTDENAPVNITKIHGKLLRLKSVVDAGKIVSKCEIKNCSNLVPIYNNICSKHLSARDISGIPELLLDLMIVRNILMRIEFLEEQISASLSNQVDPVDLRRAINEADTLSKL